MSLFLFPYVVPRLFAGELHVMRPNPMKETAYTFARKVDEQIAALNESDYLQRNNQGKVLLEEWYPISRLGLHFKQPGLEVKVEAFDDSGDADGRISITGFREAEFDIQVTCCFDRDEAWRMELLVSEGAVPTVGEIWKDESGKIHADQGVVDHYEYIDRTAQRLVDRFRRKSSRYAYRSETVLILAFDEIKLRGSTNWTKLLSSLEDEGGVSGSDFESVYLFNSASGEIRKAA